MPTEPCPNEATHGNPFRYCPSCDWMEAPPVRKPQLGDTVLVGHDPAFNNHSKVAPAIVTRVWNDTCINARVLPDSVAPSEQRFSITYVATVEEIEGDDLNRAYRWTWPPRT